MHTKLYIILGAALCGLLAFASPSQAQGTAFTYQGEMNSSGGPANGDYDFTFALFDSNSTNSGQISATITNLDVRVTNGLFTVTIDFGSVFNGSPAWLSIAVRTNGAANFVSLSPLQELTPTPNAIYSANTGSVAGSNIVGAIAAGQLPSSVVTNGEVSVNLTGSFSGNGTQLTNVTATTLVTNPIAADLGFPTYSTNSYVGNGTYLIPVSGSFAQIIVKLWGAGGGSSLTTRGGGGAFSQVTFDVPSSGGTYALIVGQAGGQSSGSGAGTGGGNGSNDASGGAGGSHGGGGGQASSFFALSVNSGVTNYVMKAVAGGGGGGGVTFGGNSGQASGSGSGYNSAATTTGVTNLDLIGGDGGGVSDFNGGQGGGYGGGAALGDGQSGGGGSYGDITTSGSLQIPGNTSDPSYNSAFAGNNQDGLGVVILIKRVPVATLSETIQAPSFLGTFNGLFSGDGSGLTNLSYSQLGPVPDSYLSTNIARRSGGNAFTGNQIVNSGYVGIGTNNPIAPLHLLTSTYQAGLMDGTSIIGTWFDVRNTTSGGTNWHFISTGVSNSEGAGKLIIAPGIIGAVGQEPMIISPSGVSVYGTFNNNSDRNAKQDFTTVTPSQILDKVAHLPVSEWSYKADAQTRHIGPMAQDFYSAFNVGTDDKHIAPIDEGGVALTAIQGLNQKLEEKDAEIKQLQQTVAELKAMMLQSADKKESK